MPYKRYVRRKRSYRSKGIGKRRMFRKLRITRRFTKPDGVNSLKFTTSLDISYVAAS